MTVKRLHQNNHFDTTPFPVFKSLFCIQSEAEELEMAILEMRHSIVFA